MHRILFIAVFLLILSGCAHTPGRFEIAQSSPSVIWPPEPEQPRYKLEGYLVGERNFIDDSQQRHVWKSALSWIVGIAFGEREEIRLKRPQAGVFDEQRQRIYVTDSDRNAVFVFDKKQGRLALWEDAGNGRSFKTPVGIAINNKGQVFVADADLAEILEFDITGKYQRSIGKGELARPTGLAIDQVSGEIFVADTSIHRIRVFNAAGELLRTIGKPGDKEGEFNSPTHLALVDDKLYVSDTLNARIQILGKNGKFLTAFGKRGIYLGDMPRPKGVAVDRDERVYVVESYYDYLLVYDGHGQGLLPMGGRGHAPGQFYLPAGVWVDTLGRVFVADMFNGRIAVLSYIGGANNGTTNDANTKKTAQSIR